MLESAAAAVQEHEELERRLADLQESMRELDAFERRCREELGRRVI